MQSVPNKPWNHSLSQFQTTYGTNPWISTKQAMEPIPGPVPNRAWYQSQGQYQTWRGTNTRVSNKQGRFPNPGSVPNKPWNQFLGQYQTRHGTKPRVRNQTSYKLVSIQVMCAGCLFSNMTRSQWANWPPTTPQCRKVDLGNLWALNYPVCYIWHKVWWTLMENWSSPQYIRHWTTKKQLTTN